MYKINLVYPDAIKMSKNIDNAISFSISRAIFMGHRFLPAVLIEENGKRKISVFDFGTLEKGVEKAREYTKKLPNNIDLYTISYDGYVHIGDRKVDCIIVEGAERDMEEGVIFVQTYIDNNFLFIKRIKPNGEAIFKEKSENYLKLE